MTKTTEQILDEIADGCMIYSACSEEEGRCWDKKTLCRNCFLSGWDDLLLGAAQGDHDESQFKMTVRIERVLRSFANQQIIRSGVQPKLDRQKFVDHYKHKIVEAYEARLRNKFLCALADRPF